MRFQLAVILLLLIITHSTAFLGNLFGASAKKPVESRRERLIEQPVHQTINQADLVGAASDLFALNPAVVDQVSERGKAQLERLQSSLQLPYCGDHVSPARLSDQCNQLNDQSKRRIAIALTNCHLSQAALPPYPCDDDADVLGCVRSLARDNTAFSSYTLFLTHVDTICVFLQRQHAEQSIVNLIDGLFTSVTLTANQLQSFEHDTAKMSKSMERTIATHQSSIYRMIESLAANETDRFVELISHTESIKQSQSNLLKQLHNATSTMLDSMRESHQMALHLSKQQSVMHNNQHSMIELQEQHQTSLTDTQKQIESLNQHHRQSINQAIESIDDMLNHQRTFAQSQEKSHTMVRSLHGDVKKGFTDATKSLKVLHDGQIEALEQARASLNQMLSAQSNLASQQSSLSQSIRDTNDEISQMSQHQRETFEDASKRLRALSEEAQAAQSKVQSSLTSVITSIDRVLKMDISLLGELRYLHAIIFYSCVIIVSWCMTATQRTMSARFWVFCLLALVIMVERFEPWSSVISHVDTETSVLIVHLLRGAMCVCIVLFVLATAALHRDLHQVIWKQQLKDSEMIRESNRLMRQLLTSVEQLPPPNYDEDLFDEDVFHDEDLLKPEIDITERPYVPDIKQKLMTDYLHTNEPGLMLPPPSHRRRASERRAPTERPRSRSRSVRKRRTQSTMLG